MDKETAKLTFELLNSATGTGWEFVKKMSHVADKLTQIVNQPETPEKPLKAVKDGNA